MSLRKRPAELSEVVALTFDADAGARLLADTHDPYAFKGSHVFTIGESPN